MGKSSLATLLLLVAFASPSFAHASKTEMGSNPRTTSAERMVPVVSPESWVAARPLGLKACNYRGGPKTGMWSCEQASEFINGRTLR